MMQPQVPADDNGVASHAVHFTLDIQCYIGLPWSHHPFGEAYLPSYYHLHHYYPSYRDKYLICSRLLPPSLDLSTGP